MKTIGLLGGTAWTSTVVYYRLLNELVAERLGGRHSAKILLKSVDYHDIMESYGKDSLSIAEALKRELSGLLAFKPDCFMVCCNSLHKYYDEVEADLGPIPPVLHAVKLVAQHAAQKHYKKVLLLATTFTMEDGFFARILESHGVEAVVPTPQERAGMKIIHQDLVQNIATEASRAWFSNLIASYKHLDAVVLGCTEYPLVVDASNSVLPIIDPMQLQVQHAVDYALAP